MMFEEEDQKALQTLIKNGILILEDKKISMSVQDTTQTTIKDEEHFWHFSDELLSDIRQLPERGIHTLSIQIITILNNCKFTHIETKVTLNIMLLQHVVRYCKALYWIQQQDQQQLTYQTHFPTGNCSNPSVSSFRRPRRMDRPTSPYPPWHLHPHHPYTMIL